MTTPTNHHLTVTTPNGTMRGQVIVVRQLGPGVANLTIETRDILPIGEYGAVYTAPS